MTDRTYEYQVCFDGGPWQTVTKEHWIEIERQCGFYNTCGEPDEPATGYFGNLIVSGRIRQRPIDGSYVVTPSIAVLLKAMGPFNSRRQWSVDQASYIRGVHDALRVLMGDPDTDSPGWDMMRVLTSRAECIANGESLADPVGH